MIVRELTELLPQITMKKKTYPVTHKNLWWNSLESSFYDVRKIAFFFFFKQQTSLLLDTPYAQMPYKKSSKDERQSMTSIARR